MAKPHLPELWVTRRTVSHRESDPSDKTTDSGGGTGDSGTGGDNEDTGGTGGSGSDKEKTDSGGDSELQAEVEKLRQRMQAADKRASTAEGELQKILDKDKSELELAQKRVKELEDQNTQLAAQNREKALNHALLTDSEFPAGRWHDPDDVLMRAERALKAEDITIEDDGTVKGSSAWLKKLAKEKSHLLKPSEKDPAEDEQRQQSGGEFNGKKKDGKGLDEAALRKKYPALR